MFLQAAIGSYVMGQSRKSAERLQFTQITHSAPKTASKRVFLITDEDNPHPGKGSQQLITSARTTLIVCELTFPVKHMELNVMAGLDTSRCCGGAILHQY